MTVVIVPRIRLYDGNHNRHTRNRRRLHQHNVVRGGSNRHQLGWHDGINRHALTVHGGSNRHSATRRAIL